jgi:paraquat-inducible protein A
MNLQDSEQELTACLQCDLLMPRPTVAPGERAVCPRCGAHLAALPRDGLLRSLAYCVSAVVLLGLAVSFPFMTMKVGGIENIMTLPQSALELYHQGMVVLSVLVAASILLIPTAILGLVLALVGQLMRGRPAPWLAPVARVIFGLGTWSMVEVFVIGVIVSLVKLASMADIVLGLSFWSYAAFGVCLTAMLSSLDRDFVWREIERTQAGIE